jgi:hypothetical protein
MCSDTSAGQTSCTATLVIRPCLLSGERGFYDALALAAQLRLVAA